MKYLTQTGNYNERRYGRPWQAILETSSTQNFTFLVWDGRPGYDGEFCFTADPGTLLASGQKDTRKNRGGIDSYGICRKNGEIHWNIADSSVRELLRLPVDQREDAFFPPQPIATPSISMADFGVTT